MDMHNWLNRSKITVGDFLIDFPKSKLIRDDKTVKLEPLAMELLCYLISRRGEYVNQRDLLKNVWNGRHVSDNAIRRVIKKIRDALGDDPKAPSYIKTVPCKGYLLMAQVQIQAEVEESIIQAEQTPSTSSWRLGLWAFAVVLLVAAGIYVKTNSPFTSSNQVLSKVSLSSGEGFWTDINPVNQAMVFSYRKVNSQPYSLYLKFPEGEALRQITRTKVSVTATTPSGVIAVTLTEQAMSGPKNWQLG